MSQTPTPALDVHRLRELFASGPLTEEALGALAPYYADDVVFTDPIQTVRGRDAFLDMNRRLLRRAKELRFDVQAEAQSGDEIFLTWIMYMTPRGLGPELRIAGVTHCTLRDGQVAVQRDYWDLLGSFMEMIPLAGAVYKAAVRLIG